MELGISGNGTGHRGAKLVREPGAGSREWGKRKQGARIVIRNPEIILKLRIKNLVDDFLKNSIFSENFDLKPWDISAFNHQKWQNFNNFSYPRLS
jgi:hypothetical protein